MTAYQPEIKGMMNGLRELDNKVNELVERMEEAEERLFGIERLGMEVDGRLNDLEVKTEELEEEVDALKDGFDDEDEEDELYRTKQEESHRPEPKELESRVVEILDEPKEQPTPNSKSVKIEPPEVSDEKNNTTTSSTTTITTVILAQPPFLKTFSLKRRLSDSSLLESTQQHPGKKQRGLSNSF